MTSCGIPSPWDNLTWAQEQRMKMIECMLRAYGYINRAHIERMFRVSTPQASADISLFKTLYPGLLEYNTSTKQYEQTVPIL
jgi:hypothetical protein